MSTWIIIPARFGSTRYPGKALAPLRGANGAVKSLIHRTWDAARAVAGVERVVVATDDARIAEAVRAFGGEVVMTSERCANGTERCADALARLGSTPDTVVNLQGDAPLTPPWFIEPLIAALAGAAGVEVATPVLRCDPETLERLLADRRAGRVGATTAVFDRGGQALYFSKEVIPFTGGGVPPGEPCPVFHHVGVYAYRPEALARYRELPAGPLERTEGLEQLRFLEHGLAVLCVEVEARGARFWELNNPSDVPVIEEILAERGID